ncbi:hypothetical protein SDC9_206721 [bioreactor metagenome]|uniref:Uncharacterized protein n=1 Tax=bioreactor metagenome TaxID=1076179 RepID=A0A645JF88_9ZZZZ
MGKPDAILLQRFWCQPVAQGVLRSVNQGIITGTLQFAAPGLHDFARAFGFQAPQGTVFQIDRNGIGQPVTFYDLKKKFGLLPGFDGVGSKRIVVCADQ